MSWIYLTPTNAVLSFFGLSTKDKHTAKTRTATKSTDPSFTAEFTGFAKSWGAVEVCLFHVLVYYSIALFGFRFLAQEKLSWIDSVYLATVMFTTVGYGDICPTSVTTQLWTIGLAGYGIVILGIFLGIMGEYLLEKQKFLTEQSRQQQQQANVGGTTKPSAGGSLTDLPLGIIRDGLGIIVVTGLGLSIGYQEGWTVYESFYWTAITSLTIGFGDYAPTLPMTRLCCCFFLPISVALLGAWMGRIASAYLDRKQKLEEHLFFQRTLTLCDLERLDLNRDGRVDKAEFLSYALVALQKVEQEDIDQIMQVFKRMDVSSRGSITKQDIGVWNASIPQQSSSSSTTAVNQSVAASSSADNEGDRPQVESIVFGSFTRGATMSQSGVEVVQSSKIHQD